MLVVGRATSAEHLYVGMTRGRQHNLACVITDRAGDEHQRWEPPTAEEVLAAALRRTSNEKSATETLRDELSLLRPDSPHRPATAIIEALREAQNHSYDQNVRRQVHHRRNPFPGHRQAPTVTIEGTEL